MRFLSCNELSASMESDPIAVSWGAVNPATAAGARAVTCSVESDATASVPRDPSLLLDNPVTAVVDKYWICSNIRFKSAALIWEICVRVTAPSCSGVRAPIPAFEIASICCDVRAAIPAELIAAICRDESAAMSTVSRPET